LNGGEVPVGYIPRVKLQADASARRPYLIVMERAEVTRVEGWRPEAGRGRARWGRGARRPGHAGLDALSADL